MIARYQLYRREQGWYWRLLGANNRALAHNPDPLRDRSAATKDAARVAVLAADGRIEVIRDGRAWRWILLEQGRVRAVSTAGYARRPDCIRAITRFRGCAVVAPVGNEPPPGH